MILSMCKRKTLMFKKLLNGLVRKVVKSDIAAEVIASELDRKAKKELDKRTGGLASEADDLAARVKATRL